MGFPAILTRRRLSRGYNLIEVVVAIGLVVVAAVGGMMMFGVAIGTQGSSTTTVRGAEIAKAELQKLRAARPLKVAFNQAAYNTLQANAPVRAEWQRFLGADVSLVRADGEIAPRTPNVEGGFTVYRYVSCDTASATCENGGDGQALFRVARIAVVGPDGSVVRLAARIGPRTLGATTPNGVTPAVPANLVVTQVADKAIEVRWDAVAGASSYRLTRDGQLLGDTFGTAYVLTDDALDGAKAGGTTRLCVRSRTAELSSSANTCLEVLTRPGKVRAVSVDGGGLVNITWQQAPAPAGGAGYRVERKRVYTEAVLRDDPVAYYRLGETAGATTAADFTNGGNDLTYSGTPALGQTGLLQNDASTSVRTSSSGYASRPSIPQGTGSINSSIEGWVRIEALPTSGQFFKLGASGLSGDPFDNGLSLGIGAGTSVSSGRELVGAFEGVRWLPSGYIFPAIGTYHVGMSVDGSGTGRFYVNGDLVGTVPGAAPIAPVKGAPSSRTVIGRGSLVDRVFTGGVDEVAVYNKVLPAARFQAHYLAGISGASWLADNPIAYWQLQSSGTDLTGHGHTLSFSGTNSVANSGSTPFNGQPVRVFGQNSGSAAAPATIDLRNRSFSIAFWARPTTNEGPLFDYGVGALRQRIVLYLRANNTLSFSFHADDLDTAPGAIALNAWQLIVATYSRGTDESRIYVNGTLRVTNNAGPMEGPLSSALINSYTGIPNKIGGEMADFAIYGSALPAARVLEMYQMKTDALYTQDWRVISGANLLQSGFHTDPAGHCDGRYRVRAYTGTPVPGMIEGRDVATSREVSPSC